MIVISAVNIIGVLLAFGHAWTVHDRILKPTDKIKVKTPDDDEMEMSVMQILQIKHPNPGAYYKEACTPYLTVPSMPALDVTGAHIQIVARRLHGAAGPSGSDAAAWQDWLLRYGAHSEHLRDVVAYLTRVMANTTVPWEFIRAIMASRLIALDKCPGVRLIEIGESLRRIMGKTVMLLTGDDIQKVCGSDQLCRLTSSNIKAPHT